VPLHTEVISVASGPSLSSDPSILIAETKASPIEGLGKTHGLNYVDAKILNLRQSPNSLLLILEPFTGHPTPSRMKRSPLVDGSPELGCSWGEDTMVRHDAGARIKVSLWTFQAKQSHQKRSLSQRLGRIVASAVCHHRQSFLEVVKRSPPPGHVGQMAPSTAAILRSPPIQLSFFSCQLQRGKGSLLSS
jgi:hypothetical protein